MTLLHSAKSMYGAMHEPLDRDNLYHHMGLAYARPFMEETMTYTINIELEIVADDEKDALNRAASLLDMPLCNFFDYCEVTENTDSD